MKPVAQTSPAPRTKQAKKIQHGYNRGINRDKLFRISSLVVFLTKAGDSLTDKLLILKWPMNHKVEHLGTYT